MNPKSFLITGANRGLGFEMVKQVIAKYSPTSVFATYRDVSKAEELFKLSSTYPCIKPVMMDVGFPDTFQKIVGEIENALGGSGLDVLINNAGFFDRENQSLSTITKDGILDYMHVNTFGPLFVTQAFLPLLEKAATSDKRAVILNFTSRLGSIADNSSGGYYASRCSRAASNAISKSMSIDLKDRNILVLAVNPGWVKTDQGGPNAPLTPEESVGGILKLLDNVNPDQSGSFFQYDGTIIPW